MEVNTESYVYTTARKMVSDYLRLKDGELQPDSHIVDDMGADSLAIVELGFQLSETFGVPLADTGGDKLIFKNLVAYVEENMEKKPG
jgi:acyl carrier protein